VSLTVETIGALQIERPDKDTAVLTRVFDAPRERVFEAITLKEAVDRWLPPPPKWTVGRGGIELRVGGEFDYMLEGRPMKHSWLGFEHHNLVATFREISPPERLMIEWPEAVVTIVLTEQDTRTTFQATVRVTSQRYPEYYVGDDTNHAVARACDRLAELLGSGYSA
jgi:uncharacterized protein YndB with AHSA1/START domain